MKAELKSYTITKSLPGTLFSAFPDSWRPIRLKFVMPYVTVGIVITPSKYYVDEGVPAIRSLNVKEGRLTGDDLVFFSEADNERLGKTRIYKDDVVIVRTGQTGSCAVVDERFDGANCIDLIIVRKSPHVRSRFLQYFLSSGEAAAEITMSSNGAIQQHFNIGLVREIALLQPSPSEQDTIVAFLDRETAKIDRLMEVRRKQVERLQEQRTAVIHHAVTKGLDRNTKMKPSGVEWLGDVPARWDVGDVKHFAHFSVGWTPPTGQDHLYDGDFPWCTIADLKGEVVSETVTTISAAGVAGSRMDITPKGSLLFSFKLSIGQVAFAGVDMFTNEAIASFPIQKGFAPRFMFYAFPVYIVENAQTNIYGAKLLNQFLIKNATMVRPPMEEQDAIVTHIDRETAKLDTLAAKYRRELELLTEYRASLISHAVTGKIDVRGLVPPVTDESP